MDDHGSARRSRTFPIGERRWIRRRDTSASTSAGTSGRNPLAIIARRAAAWISNELAALCPSGGAGGAEMSEAGGTVAPAGLSRSVEGYTRHAARRTSSAGWRDSASRSVPAARTNRRSAPIPPALRVEHRGGLSGRAARFRRIVIERELDRGLGFVRMLGEEPRREEQLLPLAGGHDRERLFRAGDAPPVRRGQVQHLLDPCGVARVAQDRRVALRRRHDLRFARTGRKVGAHQHARRERGRDRALQRVRGVRRAADHRRAVVLQQLLQADG